MYIQLKHTLEAHMKGLTKIVTVTAMLGMLGACSGMKEIEIRDTKAHPT